MNIDEFRNALRRLLDDATRDGLDVDDLLEAADKELHPGIDEALEAVERGEFSDLPSLNDSRRR